MSADGQSDPEREGSGPGVAGGLDAAPDEVVRVTVDATRRREVGALLA